MQVLARRVVVDIADDAVRRVRVELQQPPELLTRVTGAVDDDRLDVLVVTRRTQRSPHQEPARRHHDDGHERHGERHDPRIGGRREQRERDGQTAADRQADHRQQRRLLE